MIDLPAIPQLIQRTKALAALDLILSPEWDSRYYSFNSNWAPGEQMASMRNGCGDEWWIVFYKDGRAALKGLGHESPAWSKGRENLSKAINSVFPPEFKEFALEPAFNWDATSFAFFCASDSSGWKRANDLTNYANIQNTGESDLLDLLVGTPQDYVTFVEEYFEKDIPPEIVSSIFALRPISADIVSTLNPDTSLEDISSEFFDEIAYPKS